MTLYLFNHKEREEGAKFKASIFEFNYARCWCFSPTTPMLCCKESIMILAPVVGEKHQQWRRGSNDGL
jgi:hypothetical protein